MLNNNNVKKKYFLNMCVKKTNEKEMFNFLNYQNRFGNFIFLGTLKLKKTRHYDCIFDLVIGLFC